MAHGIVNLLEIIDIQEQHGQLLLVSSGVYDRPVKKFLEHGAIGQAGQAVMVGQKAYLFIRLLKAACHVLEGCCEFSNFIISINAI